MEKEKEMVIAIELLLEIYDAGVQGKTIDLTGYLKDLKKLKEVFLQQPTPQTFKEAAEKEAEEYAKQQWGVYYDDVISNYGSELSLGEITNKDYFNGMMKAYEYLTKKEK